MNSLKNNPPAGGRRESERRMLPFFIEFVKFSSGFAAIVAVALLTLHVASVSIP
ncbi:hypothetical protein HY478_03175 [Candidatus Uhrbacteria bacterium]|nr:hypothetical protein [Candidatus Uhrbacteria bacterium]